MGFLERIAQLSEEQRARLAEDNPLSFAQQRLWFVDQLAPGGSFYNTPAALRLRGTLDVAALQRTLDEIVARHEALRTCFPSFQGTPFQAVMPPSGVPMPLIDLREVPADAHDAEVRRLATEEVQRPFDLLRGPIFRARLFRLAETDHVLVLTMHHIVSDGWSVGVLANEICVLYAAFSKGEPSPLPDLPIQYADFAHWQRERLDDARIAGDLAYWRERLTDVPPLEMATDFTRPPFELFHGSREFAMLPPDLAALLRELARREGATLFMVLLAAFKVMLHRYTGQEDIAVASPIANRNRPELETLIGFFVNTLVMRTDISGDPSFVELLQRVREVALGAYDHQDLPFERLVEELNPVRDMSRSPLAQVAFALQNAPRSNMELPGMTIARQEFDLHTSRLDIEWHVWEEPDGLRCMVAYSTDLFEADTIRRMLEHFGQLLRSAAADPQQRVSEMAIMTNAEQRRIIHDWGRNPAEFPVAPLIHEMIARNAVEQPQTPAVVAASEVLTYAELNRRANIMARRLADLGAGPEQCVAVCLERSPALIASMLAIWKAGAAYVPIDPEYPTDRIHFMLDDCAARVVITEESTWRRVGRPGVETVFPETVLRDAADDVADFPTRPAAPDQLAYVIYTSGSTGRPKGVAVEHRTLLNFAHWQARTMGYAPGVRIAQMASPSFDASVAEIWPSLAYGGTLCIVDDDARMEPERLRDWAVANKAAVLFAPTVIAEMLVQLAWPASAPLRLLFTGGEALKTYPAPNLPFRFSNNYGPTENTVAACMGFVAPDAAPRRLPTIGTPSGNVEVYILDRRMKPVPTGVPGEICLGGRSVARGYLNRPELTAERFVANPFGEGRLYKTGDRARFLGNGEIEFLGRYDDQVKVRGYRIELGEIESVLRQHPAVQDTAVVVRADHAGDRHIAAYVVQNPSYRGAAADAAEASQVEQWRVLYDDAYRQGLDQAASHENFRGWNSSYTGEPIPLDEMREWADTTAARIRALHPRRVLEIGCGAGLLIGRVAPGTERYVGIDLSASTLAHAARLIAARPDLSHVEVRQGTADALEGFDAAAFDVIVVNSVIQYFPSVLYLLGVVDNAARLLRPGGHLFVGDIRSYPLLDAYAASVCLHQADDALARKELAARAQSRARSEEELCVAPAFWHALRTRIPRMTAVRTEPRAGRARNELTRFRYNAIMTMDAAAEPMPATWHDWVAEGLTRAALEERLAATGDTVLCVRGIPNARLDLERELLAWLHADDDGLPNVAAFRAQAKPEHGLEPDDLHAIAARHGFNALLDVSQGGDTLDAAFVRGEAAVVFPGECADLRAWDSYANNPLSGLFARTLVPDLRRHLQTCLPAYMEPSDFVLLERLPLTAHGKVDRRALPEPDRTRRDSGLAYVAPRTATEESVACIWREVLSRDQVGVEDTFFALGGHSLLATQVMSRVRSRFNVDIALRVFFEQPTVAALAAHIEAAAKTVAPPLVPQRTDRQAAFPLSFAQQRLWFIEQLAPGSTAYAIPTALRLSGALDAALLEGSLAELIRRHETLRTVFETNDGGAVQRVLPADCAPSLAQLRRESVAQAPPSEREDAVRALVRNEIATPFDLTRGPLMRGLLIALAPDEHVLVLNLHHIVSDGWSMGVLGRELGALYIAFAQGGAHALPALPVQYADFAVWQRGWLRDEALESELGYWRERLAGAPALQLPADRPRPAVQTFNGARVRHHIPGPLAAKLNALGEREGATLFMTLLAAFNLLLARYTGQDDIVVGSAIANRNRAETESLIGFFVNSLVLRTRLDGDPSFVELLHRVRTGTLEAYEHQDVPFEKLVAEIEPTRDLSRNPLFQVMFLLQNAPRAELALPGIDVGLCELPGSAVRFDLEFQAWESPDGLACSINYNTDLFDEATIARLAAHYERVLAAVAADPLRRVSGVDFLGEAERRQVLTEWTTGTTQQQRPWRSVPDVVAAHAAERVAAVAVCFEGRALTYAELDARANSLARRLRKLGADRGSLVGVCMERSPEWVAALLAVWKAGAAYVAMDPAYPDARLAYLVEDSGASVVLASPSVAGRFPAGVQTVVLNASWDAVTTADAAPVSADLLPSDLAYVIYTSGSTGRPKGVCVEHGAMHTLIDWHIDFASLTDGDRVGQVAGPAFDASIIEIWPTLLVGARLHIMDDDTRLSAETARDWLLSERVTESFLPTPIAERALFLSWPEDTAFRLLLTGGDTLHVYPPPGLPFALTNNYGPTENTVVSTSTVVPVLETGERPERPPTIGRPIVDNTLYILDRWLQPVPPGIPGEIFVGGASVARGYLNRPELTAERFVPNPFGEGRLYRTGDAGRFLPNGEVEFLGRLDNQVKIHGFRIELGEIESALARHSAVREAAVVVREDRPGDKQIAAYVTLNNDAEATGDALRESLKAELPAYMVPAFVIVIEAFTLTPNGKVDRRALPAPNTHGETRSSLVAPRTPDEAALAEIWRDVLGVAEVGVENDFFAMGGHSLLATQLASRVRDRFGVNLPLREFFSAPTIASLAERLEQARAGADGDMTITRGTEQIQTGDALARLDGMTDAEMDALLAQLTEESE